MALKIILIYKITIIILFIILFDRLLQEGKDISFLLAFFLLVCGSTKMHSIYLCIFLLSFLFSKQKI